MTAAPLRIGIVGAGPGGLVLGALLRKQGLPFTIFELRARPTDAEAAKPAGSLDLHEGSGLAAIRELGLFDKFSGLTGDCSQALKIADKKGNILYAEEDEGASVGGEQRPEIARNKLSQLLLAELSPASIRWQHKLVSAELAGKEVKLDFGSNGVQTFDLVVGADGAWSKVRPLLTDATPQYAGQQNITASVRSVTSRYPHLAELVGTGTFMALGDRHGIVVQRAAGDTARLYTLINTQDEQFVTTRGLREKSAAEAKTVVLEGEDAAFKDFGPVLRELITAACDDETAAEPGAAVEVRPMYTLCTESEPKGPRWESKPGVTLLGDAAHLMPPNGEGVNMAMQDALELSRVLAKAHKAVSEGSTPLDEALQAAVREYETAMFGRVEEVAGETEQMLSVMYGSENGAEEMVKFFKAMMAGEHQI